MITTFKIIDESKLYFYYACSDGYILRVLKSTYEETKVSAWKKNGKLTVKINQKEKVLKHLIAKAFLLDYFEGASVVNSDGDFRNCSADNLIVLTKQELGKQTGALSRQQPITVFYPDGNHEHFSSIRTAADSLHCSYQTILNYLKGAHKTSVLDGLVIQKAAS